MGSVINFKDHSSRPVEDDIDTQYKKAALRLKELEIDRLVWELRCAKSALFWKNVRRALFWAAVLWLLMHWPVHAQQTTFRDARGSTIGYATRQGNVTTFRNARGSTTGTATRNSEGTVIYRDDRGRTIGRSSR